MLRLPRVIAIAFFLGTLACGPAAIGAARAHARPDTTDAWPQFLLNPHHTSVSPDAPINAQTAGGLGINWMVPLRSADLSSPVAAYNAKLGKTVVYVGDERGDVLAFDESTGAAIWSTSVGVGDSMRATPMVAPDGSVWVATAYGSTVYKLDGTTGKITCGVRQKITMDASPTFATPPHGVPTVFISTNDVGQISGVTTAIDEANCKTKWTFSKWITYAGSWTTAAYAVDLAGEALIFVGTADPDSREYALDAKTGKRVWDYKPQQPAGDFDVGAASTVSPPGTNGFKDGVLYFPTKYGILNAVDLHTGSKIWTFPFRNYQRGGETGISSAAFNGASLFFGASDGAFAVNAVDGSLLWHYLDPTQSEVLSSPAVMGSKGNQVVGFGDAAGAVHVVRASDGTDLYDYQTGNYITSSPAIVNGHMLIDSSDGFLYDFTIGGGNTAPGTTAITSPSNGSSVPNPGGTLTVTGQASDPATVTGASVSVQQGGPNGPWWNAATNSWSSGAITNFVPAASPGQTSSTWSLQFPVPPSGSTYQVFANAVDALGQADRKGAQSTFTVMPNQTLPQLVTSAQLAPPGGSFTVSGSAFGPDETVDFTLQNHKAGSAVTDGNGNFPATTINVPTSDGFGPSTLVATGQTSKLTSSAPIDITNVWADASYGATRTSFEPNDTVFARTLQTTNHGYLALAWLYPATAPVDASPAVVAGVAYVADDAGTVTALNTASGAPLWSYTTPSGAPIHGSPAVDGNYLFFGSDDGVLYSLDASTGAPLGTTTLDGIPTAPAVAGGSVFVATDNGTVFDVSEANGTIVWQSNVGAAIHSAPSVDLAANVVAVGDDSGHVTELSAIDGSTLLTQTTGAAVTTPVAIAGGDIFVGSTDGSYYAFNEMTGSPVVTYALGSPIHALEIAGSKAYLGDDAGALTLVGATTGTLTYSISFGTNPIVGVSGASGVPFAEMANGEIGVIKDSPPHIVYTYQTGSGLTTAPALVDGAAFVAAEDTTVLAFTPFGNAPIDAKEHGLFAKARLHARHPKRWAARPPALRFPRSAHAFAPLGPREFPLLVERPGSPATSAAKRAIAPQRAPRVYAIFWSPGGASASLALARLSLAPSGAAVDAAPYPAVFNDAAVQREIGRQIAANRWRVDRDTQMIVVGARAAGSRAPGYCAYRSAFDVDGQLGAPVPYAFVPGGAATLPCGGLGPVLTRLQAEMRLDPLPGH